jgi:hypothetical protein
MCELGQPSLGYSRAEKEYMQLARKALDASANVELSSNEMLWGFEADIVIRVYDGADAAMPMPMRQPRGTKHIINVEIDGPRHANARTRGFTQRRDEHLRLARGVRVVRWDLMSQEQQKKRDGIMQDFRDLIKGPLGAGRVV